MGHHPPGGEGREPTRSSRSSLQLKAQHDARTENNADFVYARERLALAQELMKEKTVSLNERPSAAPSRPASRTASWPWRTPCASPRARSR
ncbi:carboxy terminal-processing peptidase [Pseudomonas aeruginosa]